MDYYYALLENYDQLKRRKFKLSLREEEAQEGEGMSDEDKVQELQSKAGPDKEQAANINGFNVWKDTDVKNNEVVKAQPKDDEKAQVAVVVKDGDLGGSPKAVQYISKMFGGGEEGESGDGGGEGGDDQEDKAPSAMQALKVAQEKAVSILKGLAQIAGITPGLEEKRGRGVSSLASVAAGDTKGFIGQVEDIEQRVFNDDRLSPEEKTGALETLTEVGIILRKIHSRKGTDEPMTDAEAKELGKVLEQIKITKGGVLIRGIAFQYREKSTEKNDALRNMVDQLNDAAKEWNAQIDKLPDEYKKDKIDLAEEPKEPPKTGGASESYRGPVAEKFMTISAIFMRAEADLAQAKTKEERIKIVEKMRADVAEQYEKALQDGSYDDLMKTFSVGRSVALGEILAKGESEISDAEFVVQCQRVLVEDMGLSPERAEQFIAEAAGEGKPDRQLMMAMLVNNFVNQNFDRQLFGNDPNIIPSRVVHMGDTNMTDSGAKADLVFEFDENCEAVAAAYADKLGSTPKDGCGGDDAGASNLLKPKEGGGCSMEVELKTLTDAKSKGGVGELSDSRRQAICDDAEVGSNVPGGMTQGTKDFAAKTTARLDRCLGDSSEPGKVQENACKKQQEIKEKGEEFERILTPGTPGVTPDMADAFLDQWFSGKKDDAKNRSRLEAAKRAMRDDPPSPEDLAQLKKVREDIQQEVLKREMPRGEVTDEGWRDWVLTSYALAAGSSQETLRVTRGLEDGYQSVYSNNAVVEDNLRKVKEGKAKVVYEGGGTIKIVDNETGETLASCDTARGNQKWTMGPKSGHRNKISDKKKSKKEEDIFITFLKGQQALLEKLMRQTSAGPNF